MKFKYTVLARHVMTLDEINEALLKEIQKPKFKSQCIRKIKEMKQKASESMWDYNHRFKIILDR